MSCCDEVSPKHVQEAFRLLNKSIIRVETPDIDFEEESAPIETGKGEDEVMENDGVTNGVTEKTVPMSKVRVPYEEYKTIANLLILRLRQHEDSEGGFLVCTCNCEAISPLLGGVRQSELINWYLGEMEAEMETLEEVAAQKLLVEKIVERLVHHVSLCGTISDHVVMML